MSEAKKTANFSVRLEQDLIDKLTEQAEKRGESRNAYIVYRLKSVTYDEGLEQLKKVCGGEKTFALLLTLAMNISAIEFICKTKWHESAFVTAKIKQSFEELVDRLAPRGEAIRPDSILMPEDLVEHMGLSVTLGTLHQIQMADDITEPTGSIKNGARVFISDTMIAVRWIKHWLGEKILSRITENEGQN